MSDMARLNILAAERAVDTGMTKKEFSKLFLYIDSKACIEARAHFTKYKKSKK